MQNNLTTGQMEGLAIIQQARDQGYKRIAITKGDFRKTYAALETKELVYILKYPSGYSAGLTDKGINLLKAQPQGA